MTKPETFTKDPLHPRPSRPPRLSAAAHVQNRIARPMAQPLRSGTGWLKMTP